MTEIRIPQIERLPEAAAQFIEEAERRGLQGRVFAFYAPMGAGQTTFISETVRQLGSVDETGSPTFSIVNEYDTERWGKVYHFDCYRLEGEEEACEIGAEDYFASGRPCFVEWPERIEGLLPDDVVSVSLRVEENGERVARIATAAEMTRGND